MSTGPTRVCFSCRAAKPRPELIRLTVDFKTGEVLLNLDHKKLQGRSAYLCKNETCAKALSKTGRLQYALAGRPGRNGAKRQVKMPLESQLIKAIADLCADQGKTCQNTTSKRDGK
ncbi:MAG: YlxR family protein [Candidatus Melainabacteria bacterium]|nr:YlxR family protein [Candidatus Melainabacteria bacterium]